MDLVSQPPKTFTVAEANAAIPAVRSLMERLQGLQRSIVQTSRERETVVEKLAAGNGYPIKQLKRQLGGLTKQQLALIEAYQQALKELEGLGCVVKDVDTGLVDFYSLRGEELVFLCWKLGEERVDFWHTLEAGYVGRQPLDG